MSQLGGNIPEKRVEATLCFLINNKAKVFNRVDPKLALNWNLFLSVYAAAWNSCINNEIQFDQRLYIYI